MPPSFRALLPLALLCTAALHAGPTDLAVVAAMKLPEAQSYSWTTSVEDDARTYQISGQTDKSDFSVATMPLANTTRRRVIRGNSNTANEADVVFKGAEKCVVQTDTGWKTPAEIAEQARIDGREKDSGGSGGYPDGDYPGRYPAGGLPGGGERAGTPPPYSNLQINLSRPAEEIGLIVGGYTEIKMDGDAVTGALSEISAKLLLVHPGQNQLTPIKANGTFRFWTRDGMLSKYELNLEGTITVETTGGSKRDVIVHQKSTTEIRAVNTTKLEVPDEARKKLEG